jgi:hypothetical protein
MDKYVLFNRVLRELDYLSCDRQVTYFQVVLQYFQLAKHISASIAIFGVKHTIINKRTDRWISIRNLNQYFNCIMNS